MSFRKLKYGFYRIRTPSLLTCDRYWQRLAPEKWSSARLQTWKPKDIAFFQQLTDSTVKERKKVKRCFFVPGFTNKNRSSSLNGDKVKLCSNILLNTKIALILFTITVCVTQT